MIEGKLVNKSNGRVWPYAIGIAIVLVFGACIGTIVVTHQLPVEKSDTYMMGYHEADARANEIIQAQIAFDKKYNIEYITDGLSFDSTEIKYKITDKNNQAVDDAKLKVVITRPNNHKNDQEFSSPKIENGIYTFENIKLPLKGRWDIMAKIDIGENQRYYNVKADTRKKEVIEY
jgi:nitrogen fixation protein FixH